MSQSSTTRYKQVPDDAYTYHLSRTTVRRSAGEGHGSSACGHAPGKLKRKDSIRKHDQYHADLMVIVVVFLATKIWINWSASFCLSQRTKTGGFGTV